MFQKVGSPTVATQTDFSLTSLDVDKLELACYCKKSGRTGGSVDSAGCLLKKRMIKCDGKSLSLWKLDETEKLLFKQNLHEIYVDTRKAIELKFTAEGNETTIQTTMYPINLRLGSAKKLTLLFERRSEQ